MRLWLRGALRQWQRHRFGTLLIVTAYALGISLSTVIYAGVAAAAERETAVAMGDPLRMVGAHLMANRGEVALDLERWLSGIKVSGVRIFLDEKGGELDPALAGRTVIALAGTMDWHPPLRSGRFLTDAEIAAGTRVAVIGEKLPQALPGYTVVGVAADQSFNRGWDRDVYVPLASLPASFHRSARSIMLHIEVAPGEEPLRAKARLEQNLQQTLPANAVSVTVGTVQEQQLSTAHRFRKAFAAGFSFSGVLLAFIAANAGVLSLHWLLQRRRELGIRLALGSTMSGITAMVAFEQLCLGLAGAVLALPLIGLAFWAAQQVGLPLLLSGGAVATAAAASLGSGLLACSVPLLVLRRTPLRESLHLQD